MQKRGTSIAGCYEIQPIILKDQRGSFVKTFHKPVFEDLLLETSFAEEYYSISQKNVLRGLHFQTPPSEHKKLVYCVVGEVMDVVVDLRKNSKTYGEAAVFNLSAVKANMLYIPEGLAHGFYVLSDYAIMVYKVTTIYSPENDEGILWSSIDVKWPSSEPVISDRDKSFTSLSNFISPFNF